MDFAVGVVFAVLAQTNESELLNGAARAALDDLASTVQELHNSPDLQSVERIGLAASTYARSASSDLAVDVNAEIESALNADGYDVVSSRSLSDVDAFVQQLSRRGNVDAETAAALREHGVDAVLWAAVERANVRTIADGSMTGPQADVRVRFNIASVGETNPGTILWSGEVSGESEQLRQMTLNERVEYWASERSNLLLGIGVILVLAMLLVVLRLRKSRR